MPSFIEISQEIYKLLLADRQRDGYDKTNSCFSQLTFWNGPTCRYVVRSTIKVQKMYGNPGINFLLAINKRTDIFVERLLSLLLSVISQAYPDYTWHKLSVLEFPRFWPQRLKIAGLFLILKNYCRFSNCCVDNSRPIVPRG